MVELRIGGRYLRRDGAVVVAAEQEDIRFNVDGYWYAPERWGKLLSDRPCDLDLIAELPSVDNELTRRDRFAMAALNAVVQASFDDSPDEWTDAHFDAVAKFAWRLADEMEKARNG